MSDKQLVELSPKLRNVIMKKYNIRSSVSADLSKLGFDISKLSKESYEYYSKNPGYYENLMEEKEALKKCEPLIRNICNGDPAAEKNSKLGCIRFIYSVLMIKSSFDQNVISTEKLFYSSIWKKYLPDIIVTFGLDTEICDEYDFNTIISIIDECIYQWSGGRIAKTQGGTYYIENNGYNVVS